MYFNVCRIEDFSTKNVCQFLFDFILKLVLKRVRLQFDQLGCGRSEILADTTLMTIDAFVEQKVSKSTFNRFLKLSRKGSQLKRFLNSIVRLNTLLAIATKPTL